MERKPNIFITNDDGIHSPGLHAAVKAVMHLGEITVVAPAVQQTGMGRSMAGNMDAPLGAVESVINGQRVNAFQCEGSPALAVQHGLNVLFPARRPDLLISGINYGENLGTNVTISGTIGAALEGASSKIPSIAISLETEEGHYFHYSDQEWDVAGHFLAMFAKALLTRTLPFDVDVLKIDVPDTATIDTPWQMTRVSRTRYYSPFLKDPSRESVPKETNIRITVDHDALETNSDIHALVVERVVSVTPLSLDLTSRVNFQELRELLNGS